MSKFSYYKGPITNRVPLKEVTLKTAIAEIRSDKHKEAIEKLRTATNETTKSVLKKSLNFFTFSGTFRKRIKEGLIDHSGYIVIDFDDVEDLAGKFKEVCDDIYTAACFISPSGTGIKVVVKIDPREHLNSFLQLEQYYKELFGLPADPSGKDVTRTCFVSYHPEAFMRDKHEQFALVGAAAAEEEKKVAKKTIQPSEKDSVLVKKERAQNLARVQYIVEQIQRTSKDLTSIYDDWVLIGFSLATFGEEGRELFHTVSRFHPEYTRADVEKRFDEAIKNTRFSTPHKFFKIAEAYGLQTKAPKTIAEAKKENEVKQFITGDDSNVSDYNKYGFWEYNGTYWSLDTKNSRYEVSNFTMRILWHVKTGDEAAYRLVVIKNIFGLEEVINMNTDDFVSVGSFRKVISRRGNFLWKGSDVDLYRLQDKLQRNEKPTKLVQQLGWHRKGKFYAFANGIHDMHTNQFIPVDEYGIVEHSTLDKEGKKVPQNYFIPAMSKIFADQEDKFANDKKFIYIENKSITFKDWAKQYALVYGRQGELILVFYLMSIYSDIIFRNLTRRFPLFFVYGMRGSGKGTMISSLMKMFGLGQDQLMLSGVSTTKAFMRKFSQYSNAPAWVDEFKNNIKPVFIESAKNIYDRIGYERATVDNTFNTTTTPIDSTCIMSGQELPADPALNSRGILCSLMATTYNETQRDNFKALVRMEAAGLSCITVHLLNHRSYIEQNFQKQFEIEQKALIKDVNNNEVDERIFVNYAALIATAELISGKEELPFSMITFRQLCKQYLLDQFFVIKGSDDTSKFWDVVEQLCSSNVLVEDKHFKLQSGYLYLRTQDVYQYYAEALVKRRDLTGLDKETLYKYLETDSKCFIRREKKWFGGAQKWCHVFKYVAVGVDLIRTGTEEETRAKYKEMGIKYIDDAGEQAQMNFMTREDEEES